MSESLKQLSIAIVLFPGMTQLDFSGPYEVFARVPGAKIYLVAETIAPVSTEYGLVVMPNSCWEDLSPLDVLLLPGGPGINELLSDQPFHDRLRAQAGKTKYLSSVCTGSLVLASAGLLDGYQATTHWRYLELLNLFDVTVRNQRVVIDRDRITGGGITAGIDFALVVVKELCGEHLARSIQLTMEYNPAPPFQCGSPQTADQETISAVTQATEELFRARKELIEQAVRPANLNPAIARQNELCKRMARLRNGV